MTPSPAERRARSMLPVIRVLQAVMPLRFAAWANERGASRARLPADVTREAVSADGVRCEWVIPRNSVADQVLLYLHGGGFVFGISPMHPAMVATLAQKMGVRALMVDYRIGPDNPYPAPLDDCMTAYHWLLGQGIRAANVVVAGDSAGGNLAITMLMKLRDLGEERPAAAACLSPVADLTGHASPRQGFKDPLLPARATRRYSATYVGRSDPREPLISPVYGDWHGLPPLLIHAGEDEILLDDAVRVADQARAAGVDVRLETYPRMWHVWQLFETLPQTAESLDDIAQFLKSHLGSREARS